MRALAVVLATMFVLSLGAITAMPAEAGRRDTKQAWGCQFEVSVPWFVRRARTWKGALLGPRIVTSATAQCRQRTRWDTAVLRLYRVRPNQEDAVIAVRRGGRLGRTEVWIWRLDLATPCRERWTSSLPKFYARAVFKKHGQARRVVVTSRPWDPNRETTCLDFR